MKQRAFSHRSCYRLYPNSFLLKRKREQTDNPTAVKTAPRPSMRTPVSINSHTFRSSNFNILRRS